MPLLKCQPKDHANKEAIYMLREEEGIATGRWERNPVAALHKCLNGEVQNAFEAARTAVMAKSRTLDPEEDKIAIEDLKSLASVFYKAEDVCDDKKKRDKVVDNIKVQEAIYDEHAFDTFFDAQRTMLDSNVPEKFCYFPFANGLFNLTDGTFRPAEPEEYLHFTTGYGCAITHFAAAGPTRL